MQQVLPFPHHHHFQEQSVHSVRHNWNKKKQDHHFQNSLTTKRVTRSMQGRTLNNGGRLTTGVVQSIHPRNILHHPGDLCVSLAEGLGCPAPG